jgi:transposase
MGGERGIERDGALRGQCCSGAIMDGGWIHQADAVRRGMQGLALRVQKSLKRDPHAGDLYIFQGRRGDLAKILWHDGIGLSLYAKRLDRGKFIWPSASDGALSISAAQMAYLLERGRLAESATDMAAQERWLECAAEPKKIAVACILGTPNHAIYDPLRFMDAARAVLARENAALKAALAVAQTKGLEVTAELAVAHAKASEDMALIAQQKLRIAKLERQVYGQRSERSARLIDQLALTFEELEASATEDELAAEKAVARTTALAGFTRKRPDRNTFPDHLPRERVVIDPPTACECCGSSRLRKLGEDVTRTLETTPRQWKVIETVREKFTCRECEKISQSPAPFHVIARGWAGASLLAMIVFEKFGQHQPLNRQAERYALEGVPIALSTMADAVGSVCTALDPLLRLVESHVMAADRLHGDDTTVPVLAEGKTNTGRCWIYVRDDKPFGGAGPPAAMFYCSRDRRGEHPQAHLTRYAGILQADAYDGYNKLYLADRKPGPVREAACWVHARRPFFAMADLEENARRKAAGKKEIPLSPIAIEVVRRIDVLFEIERSINGKDAEQRLAVRRTLSQPFVDDLHAYMRTQLARLARGHDLVKAINYMLNGPRSRCSSRRDACACPTMLRNEGSAVSRWEENRGCSAGPIAAGSAPRPCTVSLSRRR